MDYMDWFCKSYGWMQWDGLHRWINILDRWIYGQVNRWIDHMNISIRWIRNVIEWIVHMNKSRDLSKGCTISSRYGMKGIIK